MMSTSFESTIHNTPSGAKLKLYVAECDSAPKAIIQINHGMAEHAARYQRFADFLNQRGYHVYAHDHRGHGSTTAPDAPLGTFAAVDGWGKILSDVKSVNDLIKSRHRDIPIICFGHSMGSTIATAYAQKFPATVNGLAAWNGGEYSLAAAMLKLLLRFERMFKGSDVPSQLASKLTFETFNKSASITNPKTPFDWLSRDEAEVARYVEDPLCGFPVSNGLWNDFLSGLAAISRPADIARLEKSMPVHLLGGRKDPCSSFTRATTNLATQLKSAGLTDVTLACLADTRHECLNEINRDQTMSDFADWLDTRFA